jgi:hypothetical protein
MGDEPSLAGLKEIAMNSAYELVMGFGIFVVLALLLVAWTLAILTTIDATCDDTRKRAGSGNATLAAIQLVPLVAVVVAVLRFAPQLGSFMFYSYMVLMILGTFTQMVLGSMVATDSSQKKASDGLITTTSLMMVISGIYLFFIYRSLSSNIGVMIWLVERYTSSMGNLTTINGLLGMMGMQMPTAVAT